MVSVRAVAGAIAVAAIPGSARSDGTTVDGFRAAHFTASNGVEMPYRLFVPDSARDGRSYPLILYLHGRAGLGTDNLKQISGGNTYGTRLWTRPDLQRTQPVYVVAPQASDDARWDDRDSDELSPSAEAALELVSALTKQLPLDTGRVYLIGQSRGGFGVWDIVTKRPSLFAAAIPVSGGGSPSRARLAAEVPVWAFHGEMDPTVPVERTREMVAALRAARSAVRYTEYAGAGHTIWESVFAEPELPGWLLSHKRRAH